MKNSLWKSYHTEDENKSLINQLSELQGKIFQLPPMKI